MDLTELVATKGEWLRGIGTEPDIVMSSRVRLARNLAMYPFLNRADDETRSEIEKTLRETVMECNFGAANSYVEVGRLDRLDRQFLVERQLISRELSESHGSRGVCFTEGEKVSLMINEEDHLRIQVFQSGFDLDSCWKQISRIDDQLEARVQYAFSEQLGYLTACPTNVGTGIRVSVLLHLPALVMTGEIKKVVHALQKISLTVRGLYGEGSQAMGDFYQISNQITLGRGEELLVRNVQEVVPRIITYERLARETLLKENRPTIHDKISRAFGTLRSAQSISSQETMDLLSSVRMGVSLGFIDDLSIPTVNELFLQTQPAHLQKLRRGSLDSKERNAARAGYLRQRLAPPAANDKT